MILITGSTGNNGTEIVHQLLARKHKVRALVLDPAREPEKVAAMQQGGAEIAVGDMSQPASLSVALKDVDSALLLSPVNPNQVELQSNFIQAAKAHGVRHIVKFSMLGAAEDSPVPLSRWHWQSEQELERSGISWTHLRPNDLMRYNTRLLLPTALSEGAIYDSLADARISMVDEEDVAEIAVLCLTRRGHEGKTYVLTGPEPLSFYDIARHLSDAFGKAIAYHPISPEKAAEAMRSAGLPEPAVALVTALRAWERENHNAVLTQTVEALLCRKPRNYAEVAAQFAKQQQGVHA
jgi:uncharacterized protein YbjT (DUF2867 family)